MVLEQKPKQGRDFTKNKSPNKFDTKLKSKQNLFYFLFTIQYVTLNCQNDQNHYD